MRVCGVFPGGASGKEPTFQCTRHKKCSFDPGVGIYPGEGNDNPFQYCCLDNSMDRGTWQAIVHSATESDMTEGLSTVQYINIRVCQ